MRETEGFYLPYAPLLDKIPAVLQDRCMGVEGTLPQPLHRQSPEVLEALRGLFLLSVEQSNL